MMKELLSVKMLDLLAQEADVGQIVNEAAKILNNPIMVIDTKFHIMVSSTILEININLWKETIQKEYVAESIISDLEESEIISRLKNGTEFIEHKIPGVPGNHKALRYPFTYNKKNVGFIGMYDYLRPFEESDKEALLILSSTLSVAFGRNNNFAVFSQDDYEYLLERLLRCDSMESARWVCEHYTDTRFGSEMILVCLEKDGDKETKNNLAADHVKDIMDRYLFHHYSAVYENRVYILFDVSTISDELWERIKNDLNKYCQKYGLIAGASFRFTKQEYIPLAARQSLYALQWTGRTEKEMMFFDECVLECMLDQCLAAFPAEFYCHPALQRLIEYDEEFHTEYLKTLEIYLNNFCSMKETAKELGIHYNTMKYRISMIENIIDDSVRENKDLKTKLYFSMYSQKKRAI